MTAELRGSSAIHPNDRIGDKYVVLREIGSGGMGRVMAAEHVGLRTQVAVKVLLPQAAAVPGVVERFVREARSAAMLRSEHVARVLDVGTLPSGMPFLVMEYLTGCDLRALLQQRGRLSVGEAIDYMLQVCEAIEEAHRAGIVHRDLKPANLFVTTRPNGAALLKVLDFGLARMHDPMTAGGADVTVTVTGEVIGSPHYMSPEHFRGLRYTDARSDIWALGVIFYEMMVGQKPFTGESVSGVMASILQDSPVAPRLLLPELPASLEAVILRCLEKRPGHRVQSVAELTDVLHPHLVVSSRGRALSIAEASAPTASHAYPASPVLQAPPPAPLSNPGWVAPPSAPVLPTEPMGPPSGVRPTGPNTTGFGQSNTHHLVADPLRKRARWVVPAALGIVLVCVVFFITVLPLSLRGSGSTPPPPTSTQSTASEASTGTSAPSANEDTPSPVPEPTVSEVPTAAAAPTVSEGPTTAPPQSSVEASRKGTLNINSIPVARIVLDGKPLGETPKIGVQVDAGNHSVTFIFRNGDRKTKSVNVKPGQTAVANAKGSTDEGVNGPGFQ